MRLHGLSRHGFTAGSYLITLGTVNHHLRHGHIYTFLRGERNRAGWQVLSLPRNSENELVSVVSSDAETFVRNFDREEIIRGERSFREKFHRVKVGTVIFVELRFVYCTGCAFYHETVEYRIVETFSRMFGTEGSGQIVRSNVSLRIELSFREFIFDILIFRWTFNRVSK